VANRKHTISGSILSILFVLLLAFSVELPQAGSLLHVKLQAKPSTDCFPVSALQADELEEDFRRACRDCRVVDGLTASGYHVIVEDPEAHWKITILGASGEYLASFTWSGSLDLALEKTVRFLRRNAENPDAELAPTPRNDHLPFVLFAEQSTPPR
jgi:hypothetical protein